MNLNFEFFDRMKEAMHKDAVIKIENAWVKNRYDYLRRMLEIRLANQREADLLRQ